ncbi:hypothetical protein [Microbacterium sp. A94]|uniref:hypothetical protein n=1 Tax=Microbacterium sp. A94 TaxID=3450717 RepID=UPI003F41D9C4
MDDPPGRDSSGPEPDAATAGDAAGAGDVGGAAAAGVGAAGAADRELPPALARAHTAKQSKRRSAPRGSIRGAVALALLAIAGVHSLLTLAALTLPVLLSWAAPPEAFLLLTVPWFAFVFGWWLFAAMFLLGLGLSIRTPSPAPQLVWAAITAVSFTAAAIILAGEGLFPWPFVPAFQ